MKFYLKVMLLGAAVLSLAACSKSRPEQMKMADNVKVVCTPEVLVANGNDIPVQVSVTYPKGYFHPKVIMNVTPVLVYEGGVQEGPTFTYQGEKVKDNYTVIPSDGGNVIEKVNFSYVEGVEKSHLELRSVVLYKKKTIEIPAIKVADGCNVTSRLADLKGAVKFKDDGYQYVIKSVAEGQILYNVNSSAVKSSELRSASINDMKAALKEMQKDERYTIVGTQVIAYASPEGGQKFNAELSDDRAASAKKAWNSSIGKQFNVKNLSIESIGQDWEGFQEAIKASNIQDKDLILRVLSMYSDPAVREKEIRNMSEIFTEINKSVFPALRRARFLTDVEYQNYSDAELEELSKNAVDMLTEEALLKIASNSDDFDTKVRFYNYAYEKYASQKAAYNIAALNVCCGKLAEAEIALVKVSDKNDPDVVNMRGAIEMQKGNYEGAVELFEKAATPEAKQNIGTLAIIKGNYKAAYNALAGTGNINEGLACILAGEYEKADKVLVGDCPRCAYLRAINAARKGDKAGVESNLNAAGDAYKAKAATDIEFAQYR